MRHLTILFWLLVFSACIRREKPLFKLTCPYELNYSGHYLRIPVTISPHQLTYQVGDTISINTVFSDSIYDLATGRRFKIEGFPFKPLSLLYRFIGGDYDSGYRVNDLHIDSIYNHFYNYSSAYADGYRAFTVYENEQYKFESQLVLKEPGDYVLLMTDLYQSHLGSGNAELNADADAITFEGQCPTLPYYLCSMIDSGDDHFEEFTSELIYLDTKVYNGRLGSIESSIGPLNAGGVAVEFSGFFGFEVIE